MEADQKPCNFVAFEVIDATFPHKTLKMELEGCRKACKKLALSIVLRIPIINSFSIFKSRQKRAYPASTTSNIPDPNLNLQPGELVLIRPSEEIFATLDEKGKYRGLFFMPEMVKFCGKKFKVYKKVERIVLESTGEMRKIMSPTVFLEGVYCDGEFHDGCDRSCFCYWREIWLKRIQ